MNKPLCKFYYMEHSNDPEENMLRVKCLECGVKTLSIVAYEHKYDYCKIKCFEYTKHFRVKTEDEE